MINGKEISAEGRFTKFPKGEALVMEVLNTNIEAFRLCYPLIDKHPNKITGLISIEPLEVLQKEKMLDISSQKTAAEENLLNSRLIKEPFYEQRSKEYVGTYWNGDPEARIHIARNFFYGIELDDQVERVNSATLFSQEYTAKIIRSLPTSRELNGQRKTNWQEMALEHLDQFIKVAKKTKRLRIAPEKLDRLQTNTELFTLKSKDARFVAYGAEMRVLLPGQGIGNPSYSVGELLNDGIIHILAKEVNLKFLELLQKKYHFSARFTPHQLRTTEHAMGILKAYGLGFLLQDANTLFEAYVDSKIPIIISDLRTKSSEFMESPTEK